jgi:peptidoglycan hydrolase-like protein with peptidoglycan-binding domain
MSVLRLLICCLTAAAFLAPGVVSADEITRQVQEELRKRRLFNGDIDGEQSPELGVALKRYQERKGFPASGVADAQTLRSMGIAEPPAGGSVPEVPILRSDVAAQPPPPDAEQPAPTPMSIAGDINVPPPSREELHEFMRRYLAACETESVSDELAFYAPRVDYFAHGIVPKTYVRTQLVAYNEYWPQRKYTMDDEITLTKRGDNTAATALVAYEVGNPAQNRKADGKVNHTIVLARQADSSFEIVGIQEQRVRGKAAPKQSVRRRSSKKKRSSGPRLTPLDRSIRKLFRGR